MEHVRIGLVGFGGIGEHHLKYMAAVQGATLTAVCDVSTQRLELAKSRAPQIATFTETGQLLDSGLIDAVLIATPHYQHPPIALAAFERDLHVLCEKPVAVTVGQARQMNAAAAAKPHLKFGIMFMLRANGPNRAVRQIVADGQLGAVSRVTWIITDWFRTHAYFASGGWRATWAGEGGGVLINQCPHNLDLLCWILDMMPKRVTAIAYCGKTHPIEVEDEVSAILEYPNGATGHFITTTGEAPGTNRLEICGDRGKLVLEKNAITFSRMEQSVGEFSRTSPERFQAPKAADVEVAVPADPPDRYQAIAQNFVNAILRNEPLIAPGEQGVRSLELGNAMLMAGLTRTPVELPLDAAAYDEFLKRLVDGKMKS